MLQFAIAFTAAAASILVSVSPASAAPTAPDAAPSTVSSAADVVSADLPSDGTGYTSDPESASAAVQRGPTCRNWSCGWAFSKTQTRALFLAIAAGGAVAGAAACTRFGGVTAVACNAAVAFVVTLVVQGVPHINRCVYVSLTVPGRHQLYRC